MPQPALRAEEHREEITKKEKKNIQSSLHMSRAWQEMAHSIVAFVVVKLSD